MLKIRKALVQGPRFQAGKFIANPGARACSELNDLVLQAVLNLTPSLHDGTRIDCALSGEDLYVPADRERVSKILCCVLEATIHALDLLPHDPSQSYSGVLRTRADDENNVALEIFHVSILKGELEDEVIMASVIVANLILRQGQEHAQRLLGPIGGQIAVERFARESRFRPEDSHGFAAVGAVRCSP